MQRVFYYLQVRTIWIKINKIIIKIKGKVLNTEAYDLGHCAAKVLRKARYSSLHF